jgi:hypothetical protein
MKGGMNLTPLSEAEDRSGAGVRRHVLSVAHVDDAAIGHLVAMERGLPCRSDMFGGENLVIWALSDDLACVIRLSLPV